MGFTFNRRELQIAPSADMPTNLRPFGRDGWLLQEALNMIHVSEYREGVRRWELKVSEPINEIVTTVEGREIIWAKHAHHTAKNVQLSPFVEINSVLSTTKLVVEFAQDTSYPLLVRANPGDYIPPLPWQSSARYLGVPMEEVEKYWQQHAYIYSDDIVIHGTRSVEPPNWFTA